MLAVSVERDAHSLGVIRSSKVFAVNVLEAGQRDLAGQFARAHLQVGDKLAGHNLGTGSTGAALLDDALASVECRVVSETPAGDHVLIVGEVVDAHVNREGAALTMKEAGFRYSG
jgi:flavin reductase (DIM6/NTAB) family NADH-FMN oxidoreductase RutF